MRAIADMADIHYVRQGTPRGLGHAVLVAREHVGDEPFAVLLGDDMMHEDSTVLSDMIDMHERLQGSVIAVKEVPDDEISLYGCIRPNDADGRATSRSPGSWRSPTADDAPSNMAVMGRYVFTPEIFDAIERHGTRPRRRDPADRRASVCCSRSSRSTRYTFDKGRFDIGNKVDYLRATVELALERPDLADEFRRDSLRHRRPRAPHRTPTRV